MGGQVRAVGVSNFADPHLLDLLNAIESESLAPISVLQTEFHLFWQPASAVVDLCRRHKIRLFGYAVVQDLMSLHWESAAFERLRVVQEVLVNVLEEGLPVTVPFGNS